jgi:RecA-family ATPase
VTICGTSEVATKHTNLFAGTFTAAELMATKLPPLRWTVPGLLPEGVTLLSGKPKLGKSWLALGLAIAVASGGVALGTMPVNHGEVLYLALEDTRRQLQKRLEKTLAGTTAPSRLHIATEWPRMDEGGADRLGDWLAVHPDARLAVVDILKKVRPRTSQNRSVYDVDYEALEALQRLAGEHGVAILVVHHTRKLAAADPVDEVSGSTGLSGGADGILVLKRDRGKADAYLHITGREIEEEAELALKWDTALASWSLVGDAEE